MPGFPEDVYRTEPVPPVMFHYQEKTPGRNDSRCAGITR
jgi:hypothetical protein